MKGSYRELAEAQSAGRVGGGIPLAESPLLYRGEVVYHFERTVRFVWKWSKLTSPSYRRATPQTGSHRICLTYQVRTGRVALIGPDVMCVYQFIVISSHMLTLMSIFTVQESVSHMYDNTTT